MARHFSNWLKAYMDYTKASEAPDAFHFWTGVVTIAGALRRRVWKDELVFQWTPNFYVILVAPPGVATKSTTIGLGMRLLRKVEGVHFGPESMTWQALGMDFEKAMEYASYTDEKGEEIRTAMSCLTIPVSELGTFLRTDDNQLVSFLTRMWDGQSEPYSHKTKSSGNIEVENPWLNIIGATTPAWMQGNFSASLIGEGLTSRIIFVYADAKRHFVPYPSRQVKSVDFRETELKLIEDLQHIALMVGPYELTREAEKWGEKWYTNHYSSRPVHMASDRFGGYIARKQTHLHKLALVLAAAKRDELVIELEDMKEAEAILTGTEHDMLKVFESIGIVDEAKHVTEIVAYVRAHKFLTSNELWRMCMNVMSQKDFEAGLKSAVSGKILDIAVFEGKKGVVPAGTKIIPTSPVSPS